MKRFAVLALLAACALAVFSGCRDNRRDGNVVPATPALRAGRAGADAAGQIRMGLGVVTDASASRSAAEGQAGRARVSSYYAALALNERGVIVAAWLDSAQHDVEFDGAGALLPLPESLLTRGELGDAYGMRRASPIGREWHEQMRDFAQWMVGRTPAEVAEMALSNGRPAGADLTASVTINVSPMLAAVARAAENAR